MAASSFQICKDFGAMLGLLLVVTGMTITKASSERNTTSQKRDTTFMNVINTRFIAARWGARISLSCSFGSLASWHKETEKGKYEKIVNSSRVQVTRNTSMVMMQINKLQHADNGIYYCDIKNISTQCCGIELKVMGISSYEQLQSRNNLKDAIILIQTILLVLFVSIPVFLTQGKFPSYQTLKQILKIEAEGREWAEGDRKDASGEEHTYEGLTVELADTYEDIGTYQDRAEKWDLVEHPCEE